MKRILLALGILLCTPPSLHAGWFFTTVPDEPEVGPIPEPGPLNSDVLVNGTSVLVTGSTVMSLGTIGEAGPNPDVTAPIISAIDDYASSDITGVSTVTTNEANGILHGYLSTSCTPPSATDLKSGAGAVVKKTQIVNAIGEKTIIYTGITGNVFYCIHLLHRDANNNDSAILSGDGFTTDDPVDITAPILSNYGDFALTSTTGGQQVATNEENGIMYWRLSNSGANPSVANLKACVGAAAGVNACGNQPVTVDGLQVMPSFSGLTPNTFYAVHWLHTDAAGNNSAIRNDGGGFTTPP